MHLEQYKTTTTKDKDALLTRRPKYLATHRSNCLVDIKDRPRSNLNTLIETAHSTSYLITIVMLALAVAILQIFTILD